MKRRRHEKADWDDRPAAADSIALCAIAYLAQDFCRKSLVVCIALGMYGVNTNDTH